MWFFKSSVPIADSGILHGMTDCHSHLLPGVDDGVKTEEETWRILDEMERQGVRKVWLTPHIMEDMPNETAALQQKFLRLKQKYQGKVELALAAEYMLDNLFEERLEKDDLLPLEEGKRYLLVETSYFNPPMGLNNILLRIKTKGYIPVLAHPERYVYMDENDYRQLKGLNVRLQLNLFSLVGAYGIGIRKKAEWLLRNSFYDLAGSDTHCHSIWKEAITKKIQENLSDKLRRFL